jgi:hypothetical protein
VREIDKKERGRICGVFKAFHCRRKKWERSVRREQMTSLLGSRSKAKGSEPSS